MVTDLQFLTSFCVTFPDHRMDLNDFCLLIKSLNRHLQDSKCTGSALVLLRNILQRSLESDDLTSLIREVKRRITNDDSVHVQEGCRAVYLVYVKNYLKTREEFMKELYDFFKALGYRKSLKNVHFVYKMIADDYVVKVFGPIRNCYLTLNTVNNSVNVKGERKNLVPKEDLSEEYELPQLIYRFGLQEL